MRKETVNGHTIMLYDSIEDLPIRNYQKLNEYVLVESGIGTDTDAIDRHTMSLYKMADNARREDLKQGLMNLRQAIVMTLENMGVGTMAFCCFIHSINGKVFTDLSDSGIKSIKDELESTRVSIGWVRGKYDELKKKLMQRSMSILAAAGTARKHHITHI